jgi:hypothetical protein
MLIAMHAPVATAGGNQAVTTTGDRREQLAAFGRRGNPADLFTIRCSRKEGETAMLKRMSPWVLLLGIACPLSAAAEDSLVRFKGGIGVTPVSSGVVPAGQQPTTAEVVNRNFVRGVQPPGQIWVIADLRADVKADGSIKVRGRGLLLGGGNGIGGNANASVFATLICEAAAPFTTRNTTPTGVPLEPNGDFRIDDKLDPAPFDCASPVLLIRSAANGAWFAAGIPNRGKDDD